MKKNIFAGVLITGCILYFLLPLVSCRQPASSNPDPVVPPPSAPVKEGINIDIAGTDIILLSGSLKKSYQFASVLRQSVTEKPGGEYSNGPFTNVSAEKPLHINDFKIAKNEADYFLWSYVRSKAEESKGYTFANKGAPGSAEKDGEAVTAENKDQPVSWINWRDAVVWCNALSELAGLTPVYYEDAEYTKVLRTSHEGVNTRLRSRSAAGTVPEDSAFENKNANGFRLPTLAEWELAAKGGSTAAPAWKTKYFETDDFSALSTYGWVSFTGTDKPAHTKVAGGKKANSLGIYDMLGNVAEWCFDKGTADAQGGFTATEARALAGYAFNDTTSTNVTNNPMGIRFVDPGDRKPIGGSVFTGFRLVRSSGKTEHITTVTLKTLTANGSDNQKTTELTLTFDTDPGELTLFNVRAEKAAITGVSGTGTIRTVTLGDVDVMNGEKITISFLDPKNRHIVQAPGTTDVTVFSGNAKVSASADGTPLAKTTEQITLTFDRDPGSLDASKIKVAGALWNGNLSGSDTMRILNLTGVSKADGESITLTFDKSIPVEPKVLTIQVHKLKVRLTGITADGTSDTVTTANLTLTFDKEPVGLTADYIVIKGAAKGDLTGSGTTRTLKLNRISVTNGTPIDVTVGKDTGGQGSPKLTVEDGNKNVQVWVKFAAPEMVDVPAGKFQRDGTPTNISEVSAFRISKYEITREQYQSVMGSDPSTAAPHLNCPVTCVTWYMAVEFCNKLSEKAGLQKVYTINDKEVTADWSKNGYRLATEMEWMWAAMGADKTPSDMNSGVNVKGYKKGYAGSTEEDGKTDRIDEYAWWGAAIGKNGGGEVHSVGGRKANELGLFDMSGNAWEWVWDRGGAYPDGTLKDFRGNGVDDTGTTSRSPAGGNRMTRGGSRWNPQVVQAVAGRAEDGNGNGYSAGSEHETIGLRVVCNK